MLKGPNILLRTIRGDELDVVHAMICDINAKGTYWHLNLPSEREFHRDYLENGFFGPDEGRMLIVTHLGEYVGEILYFKGLDYQSGPEIGYELFSSIWYGKGIMTEALRLFCAWYFSVHPVNRVQVNLMKGNTGSRRVAEKCGFTYEGTLRQATFHRGTYHDLEMFSLLREECPSLESILSEVQ